MRNTLACVCESERNEKTSPSFQSCKTRKSRKEKKKILKRTNSPTRVQPLLRHTPQHTLKRQKESEERRKHHGIVRGLLGRHQRDEEEEKNQRPRRRRRGRQEWKKRGCFSRRERPDAFERRTGKSGREEGYSGDEEYFWSRDWETKKGAPLSRRSSLLFSSDAYLSVYISSVFSIVRSFVRWFVGSFFYFVLLNSRGIFAFTTHLLFVQQRHHHRRRVSFQQRARK